MVNKYTDDEIRAAGRKAVAEAGGDIGRVSPGALRRLLGGGEPNANHARMLALLGPEMAAREVEPVAVSTEAAALAADLAEVVAKLVEERVGAALGAREAELVASAERRVAKAVAAAEAAEKALLAERAERDADVAALEDQRDAAIAEADVLRTAVDVANGRVQGLEAAFIAIGATVARQSEPEAGRSATS